MTGYEYIRAMSARKFLLSPMLNFFPLGAGECGDYPILCEDCQFNIQYIGDQHRHPDSKDDPHFDERNMHHHSSQEGFQKAALEGCRICGALWRKLSISQQNRLLSFDRYKYGSNNAMTLISIFPTYFSNPSDQEATLVNIGFNFLTERERDIFTLGAQCILHPAHLEALELQNIEPQTGRSNWSDRSIDIAKGWIKECTESHAKCSLARESVQWYPTRLIDVGDSVSGARLVITSEHMPSGPYVSLSHCWGRTNIVRLTRSRLTSFTDGTALADLPRTFAHAILVAKELKSQYIWIDSLCIFQDDLQDWQRESSLMHKIYSNSMCNIAATGAVDSSEGLFFERDPSQVNPAVTRFRLDYFSNPMKPDPMKPQGLHYVSEATFWSDNVLSAPLNRRGWVCQERLLAPRILHFAKAQLLWECCEMEAAERYPTGLPPIMVDLDGGTRIKKCLMDVLTNATARASNLPDGNNQDLDTYEVWNKIIKIFTSSSITKSSDKLAALSGIAKRVKDIRKDEYVAGLWRRDLARQLLWTVVQCKQWDGSPSERPTQYRAPSFSWAAVDGVITPTELVTMTGGTTFLDVLGISTTPMTEDTTGPLEGGYLHVAGTLKSLQLHRVVNPTAYIGYGLPYSPVITTANEWVLIVNGKPLRPESQVDWRSTVDSPDVCLDVMQESLESQPSLYCVNVLRHKPAKGWERLYGIILEHVPGQTGAFKRIGVYRVWVKPIDDQDTLVEAMLKHHDDENMLPCESYDRSTRKHVFRII